MLRTAWRNFPSVGPYLIVVAIAVALFFPTWLRLAQEWLKWEQVLAHGLPTFALALGLLLVHPPHPERKPLAKQTNTNRLISGSALMVLIAFWTVVELARIDTLAYLLLPPGILATAFCILGYRATLSLTPYVFLLSLALPFWADLVPVLVTAASVVVGTWVSWLGLSALIEGSSITLPYGRLVIADGCSGIGYLAISVVLAAVTAILNDCRLKEWLALCLGAVSIALVVNWVRVTVLVVVAYASDMQSDLIRNHELFGWFMYASFAIPALLMVPTRRRKGAPPGTPFRVEPRGLCIALAAFVVGTANITLAQVSADKTSFWTLADHQAQPGNAGALPFPLNIPASLQHSVWQTNKGKVWISLAQSHPDLSREKLVPYLANTLRIEQWYQIPEAEDSRVEVYRRINGHEAVAIIQWFQVGSYRTNNYFFAKLLQIPAIFSGHTRFALVTLQTRCGTTTCEQSIQHLTQLHQSLKLSSES